MYAKVTVYKDTQQEEHNFQFDDSVQLTSELYELACDHNYYITALAVIVGDGYAGRWKMFNDDGTGTVKFNKDGTGTVKFYGSETFLKHIDSISITVSK